jgi:hypothetical protein
MYNRRLFLQEGLLPPMEVRGFNDDIAQARVSPHCQTDLIGFLAFVTTAAQINISLEDTVLPVSTVRVGPASVFISLVSILSQRGRLGMAIVSSIVANNNIRHLSARNAG